MEKTLREAAADAVRWLQSPKDGHANEVFDDIADWFEHDTGLLRPGKDYPIADPPPADLDQQWTNWCNEKRRSIAANLRAALENTQGEDREADRPDLEKALEEAASFFGGEWMDHAKLIESQRPHFAAWLKSRERGA